MRDSALSATGRGGRDELSLLKSSRMGVGHAGVAMRNHLSTELCDFLAGGTFVCFLA